MLRVAGEIAEREQQEKITEEHIRSASLKMEEDKETIALESYTKEFMEELKNSNSPFLLKR